ncbi:hypothetical protein GCM10010406_53650 [Streptomyces thermolineatus]|uniref:Lipoprotein n=1 Tax=Streptomyces thermolineatus TaxID=44033 RepID=A0ABP6A7Y6_9ACTN
MRKVAIGCAALLTGAVLAGCGGGDESAAGSGGTASAAPATPAAGDSTGPGKHEGSDTLEPPKPPAPRGPVLRATEETWTYDIRIVSARTAPEAPDGTVVEPGRTNVIVSYTIKGTAPDRPSMAPPHGSLRVVHPACEDNLYKCPRLASGTTYYTGDQAAFGYEGQGVEELYGKLDAGATYYASAWGAVSEETDLGRAELCDGGGVLDKGDCIPLGEVTKG